MATEDGHELTPARTAMNMLQSGQVKRAIGGESELVAEHVMYGLLDRSGAEQFLKRRGELAKLLEPAFRRALTQLATEHPLVAETEYLRPVAQTEVPAREEKEGVANRLYQDIEYGERRHLWQELIKVLGWRDWKIPLDRAIEGAARPYAVCEVKKSFDIGELLPMLPAAHLAAPADLFFLVDQQHSPGARILRRNGQLELNWNILLPGSDGQGIDRISIEHWLVANIPGSASERILVERWDLEKFPTIRRGHYLFLPGYAVL